MMIWKSLGLLYFTNNNNQCWMQSHAALPTILKINNDEFLIFFSTRDLNNRSSSTYVKINMRLWQKGQLLKHEALEPSLTFGQAGLFDDCGVTICSFLNFSGNLYGYYLGWTRRQTTPFCNEIGIFSVCEDYSLKKTQKLPVYGRSEVEPFTFGYPTIYEMNGETVMIYDGIDHWNDRDKNNYRFDLRYSIMKNPCEWSFAKKFQLELKTNERAVTRPAFFELNGNSYVIFSLDIGGKYSLAAAVQVEGGQWRRLDDFKFFRSGESWDADECAYPNVFSYNSEYYMLYNGNRFGKTGFGIAKLVTSL